MKRLRLLPAIALPLLIGGCSPAAPKSAPPQAVSEVGRYVIVHSPEAERDTILLDTVTGKTWSRVQVTDVADEPPAWDPMPQLNTKQDLDNLIAAHGWKAKGRPSANSVLGATPPENVPSSE